MNDEHFALRAMKENYDDRSRFLIIFEERETVFFFFFFE